MSSEGFWPGEAPAAEQDEVREPEAAAVAVPPAAEPVGWPQPREEEEATNGAEPEGEAEPQGVAEPEGAAEPEAEGEPEPEAEEEQEVAPTGHVPGDLDIPDGVAVLEGSPSGAQRTVGIVVVALQRRDLESAPRLGARSARRGGRGRGADHRDACPGRVRVADRRDGSR